MTEVKLLSVPQEIFLCVMEIVQRDFGSNGCEELRISFSRIHTQLSTEKALLVQILSFSLCFTATLFPFFQVLNKLFYQSRRRRSGPSCQMVCISLSVGGVVRFATPPCPLLH